ncbi:MAG: putative bifunctional diguanylate cyclase/phosphodiesterase [Cyanophyceae cyanobacterium]
MAASKNVLSLATPVNQLGTSSFRSTPKASNAFQMLMLIEVDRLAMLAGALDGAWVERVLEIMAERLGNWVGTSGWSRRLQDGRFLAMVSREGDRDNLMPLTRELQQLMAQPMVIQKQSYTLTVSIGTVLGTDMPPLDPEDVDASGAWLESGCSELAPWHEVWLRNAQSALLHAQGGDREGCVLFDPSLHQELMEQWELEMALRQAIANNQLQVHYQPIVSPTSGEVRGFEALCRWYHPKRGWISPVQFIPIAEEIGLIIELGRWVLEMACNALKSWQRQGLVDKTARVSVNVAPQQFDNSDFVATVRDVLARTELDPQCLSLEVIEGAFAEGDTTILPALEELRRLGISISIDDFGTGYSSLSRLTQLPIDTLKIDRSFVEQMEKRGDDLIVIWTLLQLAENLGLTIIAEGASTRNHVEMLKEIGDPLIQGYYFARALPPEMVPAWFREIA